MLMDLQQLQQLRNYRGLNVSHELQERLAVCRGGDDVLVGSFSLRRHGPLDNQGSRLRPNGHILRPFCLREHFVRGRTGANATLPN